MHRVIDVTRGKARALVTRLSYLIPLHFDSKANTLHVTSRGSRVPLKARVAPVIDRSRRRSRPRIFFSPAVSRHERKISPRFPARKTRNIAHGKKPSGRAFYRTHKWEEAARHGANSRHRVLRVSMSRCRGRLGTRSPLDSFAPLARHKIARGVFGNPSFPQNSIADFK